jgi:hypothetical protein
MDDHPCGTEMLCHDPARFRHLLGDDIKGDFLHGHRAAIRRPWT